MAKAAMIDDRAQRPATAARRAACIPLTDRRAGINPTASTGGPWGRKTTRVIRHRSLSLGANFRIEFSFMSAIPKGLPVNRAMLAKTFGVSVVTVDGWVSAGCPIVQRGSKGREYQFDTAAVAHWRERQILEAAMGKDDSMDVNEAKRRKLVAEAALAEIERDFKLNQIVLVSDVSSIVSDMLSIIRTRLLAMPSNVAGRIAGSKRTAPEVSEAIMVEVTQALTELSSGDDVADKACSAPTNSNNAKRI
jgi:phage terminase Nu1 subunit (DNA packaging protein)